jgi:hypothetical protein
MDRILILFLTQYYQTRLQNFEELNLNCPTDKLLRVAAEASSLHKFILDAYEEGYTDSTDQIVTQTDALNRLEKIQKNFITELHKLGHPVELKDFYLCPEVVQLDNITSEQFKGGNTFELFTYLDLIDHQSDTAPEIEQCFSTTEQKQRWHNKTQLVMAEMVDFLVWVVQRLKQQPKAIPVPLLRDTLVVQLGLQLIRRSGIPIRKPKPLLLSRKFLSLFQNGERIYDILISDILYALLYENKANELAMLRCQFVERAKVHSEIPISFIQASNDYFATLALDGPPLIIESGMHGTFPLWLLTLTDNRGDMVLYNTVPWLYSTYSDISFRKNYNYLRDIETIIAHEYLFQFKTISKGKIIVVETSSTKTQTLALYELYVFKTLLKKKL